MIQTQELRIGNIFNDEDNTPCYFAGAWQRSDGWIARDSAGNTYKESQLYPIALDPGILEACGFVYNIYLSEYQSTHLPLVHLRAADEYEAIWITSGDSETSLCSVKYLHQLQNLFFTLTGTELTINLEKVKV